MSPPRSVSKNETSIWRNTRSEARRFASFPLRPSVIACGCSHSKSTSGTAPALRAATIRRCSSHAALYSTNPRWTTKPVFMVSKRIRRSELSTLDCQLLARLRSTLFRPKNPLDLLRVVDVVPSVQANDMLDSLFAPLGVHAVVFPLFRFESLQQGKIRFAEHAEHLDGFARIALFVMAGDRPGILIERLNRCPGRPQNLPYSPASDQFRVGEMR